MQHLVQRIEGFEPGGNVGSALELLRGRMIDYLRDTNDKEYKRLFKNGTLEELEQYIDENILKEFGKTDINSVAFEVYKNLYGEKEALSVEDRILFTDEERKRSFPRYGEGAILQSEISKKENQKETREYAYRKQIQERPTDDRRGIQSSGLAEVREELQKHKGTSGLQRDEKEEGLTEKQRREEYPTYNEGVIKRDNFEGRQSENFKGGQNNRPVLFRYRSDEGRIPETGSGRKEYEEIYNSGRKYSDSGLAERESSYIQGRQEGREIINERSDLTDDMALLDEINGFNEPAAETKTEEKKTIYSSEEWDKAISEFEKAILDGTIILKLIKKILKNLLQSINKSDIITINLINGSLYTG